MQRCQILFFYLYILTAFFARSGQSAIRLSAPMEIWPPTVTTNLFGNRSLPVIAANDNGALLAWVERDVTGATNIMAVGISKDGQMVQPFGRLIASEGFSGSVPEIYPAGDEFYVVFRQARANPFGLGSPSAMVFTRVSGDGRALAPLQTIDTNFNTIASHSNGQSLLSAWAGGKGETVLKLFRRDGAIVRTVLQTGSAGAVKVSSVGRTYLVVQQDRDGRVQGIVVNGYTGAVYTNMIVNAPGFTPLALSSDESQYLLATRDTNSSTQFFLLSGDATVLATGMATNTPLAGLKLVRYGAGWLAWGNAVFPQFSGQIVAYSVTSNGGTVEVGPNPLPTMSGQTIAPFGDKALVVGQQTFTSGMGYRVGYKVVTASGESPVQFPLALSRQYLATVASSPNGYLALWKEQGDRTNLVGVRFASDGTRQDATPFIVVTNVVAGQVRAIYETNAYHVVWVGSNEGRLIDPAGPPNVRAAGRVTISNIPDLEVTKFAGELVAYQRGTAGTSISHGSQSALKSQIISLTGTDEHLFEVNAIAGQLWAGLIAAPLDSPARTNMLGVTMLPAAVAALDTNFFVAWHDLRSTNIVGAIVSEDGSTRTNILFKNVSPTIFMKAASSDNAALLAVTLTNNIGFTPTTNFLALYDKTSGTYSITSQILPIVTNTLSIASLGEDFVIATSVLGEAGPVATLQFVTATASASATISVNTDGGLTITFENLETARRYRIERSTDLVNWEFLQSVSQTESLRLPVDATLAAAFYRAVLEPE